MLDKFVEKPFAIRYIINDDNWFEANIIAHIWKCCCRSWSCKWSAVHFEYWAWDKFKCHTCLILLCWPNIVIGLILNNSPYNCLQTHHQSCCSWVVNNYVYILTVLLLKIFVCCTTTNSCSFYKLMPLYIVVPPTHSKTNGMKIQIFSTFPSRHATNIWNIHSINEKWNIRPICMIIGCIKEEKMRIKYLKE